MLFEHPLTLSGEVINTPQSETRARESHRWRSRTPRHQHRPDLGHQAVDALDRVRPREPRTAKRKYRIRQRGSLPRQGSSRSPWHRASSQPWRRWTDRHVRRGDYAPQRL